MKFLYKLFGINFSNDNVSNKVENVEDKEAKAKMTLKKYLLDVINDIQLNQKKYNCYPYPKTIRSILSASEKSKIAHYFSDKNYYGIFKSKVSLMWIIELLNELVSEGYLYTEKHNDKNRYLLTQKAKEYNPFSSTLGFDELNSFIKIDETSDDDEIIENDDYASIENLEIENLLIEEMNKKLESDEENNFNLTDNQIKLLTLRSNNILPFEIEHFYLLSADIVVKDIDSLLSHFSGDDIEEKLEDFKLKYSTSEIYKNELKDYINVNISYKKKLSSIIEIENNIFNYSDYSSNINAFIYSDEDKIWLIKGSQLKKDVIISKKWLDNPEFSNIRNEVIKKSIIINDKYLLLEDFEVSDIDIATACVAGEVKDNVCYLWKNSLGTNYRINKEIEDLFDESAEEKIVDDFSKEKTIEMLKKHFERNDLKKKLNQYNINSVCRFLEEIYGKVLVSNINDLNQFIDDFNNCLDLLKPKARELLINKYGLRDGVKKTASELSITSDLSTAGIGTSVYNSMNILRESERIDNLRKYFVMQDDSNEEKDKEDIEFVLSLLD